MVLVCQWQAGEGTHHVCHENPTLWMCLYTQNRQTDQARLIDEETRQVDIQDGSDQTMQGPEHIDRQEI